VPQVELAQVIRPDVVVGGDLAIHNGEHTLRGPIAEVSENFGGFNLLLDWVAINMRGTLGEWHAWSYGRTQLLAGDLQASVVKGHAGHDTHIRISQQDRQDYRRRGSTRFEIYPATATRALLNPRTVIGMPPSLRNSSTWKFPRVELGDDEWAELSSMPVGTNSGQLADVVARVHSQAGFVWPAEQHALRDTQLNFSEAIDNRPEPAIGILRDFMRQLMDQVESSKDLS
jgi:hypothetical protein